MALGIAEVWTRALAGIPSCPMGLRRLRRSFTGPGSMPRNLGIRTRVACIAIGLELRLRVAPAADRIVLARAHLWARLLAGRELRAGILW